jgi:hypothetical protein
MKEATKLAKKESFTFLQKRKRESVLKSVEKLEIL